MKTLSVIIAAFLCLAVLPLAAQEVPTIAFGITVSNGNGATQDLLIGAANGATSNLDQLYNEYELPPLPPAEIFDARCMSTPGKSNLGSGSLTDYRGFPGTAGQFTETYTIGYQAGQGASGVTLAWEQPFPSRMISCTVDGQNVNSVASVTTQFAQGEVTVVMTMSTAPLSITANPSSLTLNVDNRQQLPTADVEITCVNDKDALWDQTVDVEWLTVNPVTANGDQTLTVEINTSILPPGAYSGNITVLARYEAVSVVIPVNIQVTVDVDDVPVPGEMWLGNNYPNPFGTVQGTQIPTTIPLALGTAGLAPSLLVYDLYGRLAADLSGSVAAAAGVQYVEFPGTGLAAGMYWCKLTAGARTLTRTMLLVR